MISLLPENVLTSPTIVTDSREQQALKFERLPSIVAGLVTADYSVLGLEHLLAIERKSIDDLCASVTTERERFERELHRMRGFHFKRLICTCTREQVEAHAYRSQANPRAVLGSLATFEIRYCVPIVFTGDPVTAALLVEEWAFYFSKEIVKCAEAVTKSAGPGPAVKPRAKSQPLEIGALSGASMSPVDSSISQASYVEGRS